MDTKFYTRTKASVGFTRNWAFLFFVIYYYYYYLMANQSSTVFHFCKGVLLREFQVNSISD